MSVIIIVCFVFMTIVTISDGTNMKNKQSHNLRGGKGGNLDQSINFLTDFSDSTININGPLNFEATNSYVIQGGQPFSPSPSLRPTMDRSPSETPTFASLSPSETPTEMPTEMPTEISKNPTEMPTKIHTTDLPSTAIPTVMPTSPLASGKASCGCSDDRTEVVELVSPISKCLHHALTCPTIFLSVIKLTTGTIQLNPTL